MSYSISDAKAIIRENLLKDTPVQAFSPEGVDVRDAHQRDPDFDTLPKPLIVVSFRGGPPRNPGAPIARRTVHLYAYSTVSQAQADRLHELATVVVCADNGITHPKRGQDGCPTMCVKALESSGAMGDFNKDVNAYFARSTLNVWTIG